MAEETEVTGEPEIRNRLVDLKKFFSKNGERMTTAEFTAEWNQLSDEEKDWFKAQSLK